MKNKILFLTAIIVILSSCSSCTQMRKLQNMKNCELKLAGIDLLDLNGTDLSHIKSSKDLSLLTAGKLVLLLFSERSILKYRVNIAVRNPNDKPAGMNRMEMIVYFNDKELGTGEIIDAVEIKRGGETIVPLVMTSDLGKVIKSISRSEALALLFPGEGESSRVFTIKVKPTFKIAGNEIKYPGYFTLTKEFQDK